MYFISEKLTQKKDAGTKARIDLETIFVRCGLLPYNKSRILIYPDQGENKVIFYIKAIVSFIKGCFSCPDIRDEIICFKYPIYTLKGNISKRIFLAYLNFMRNKNNLKLAAFVMDVDSMRKKDVGGNLLKKEISFLNHMDIVILFNKKIISYLNENGLTNPMIVDWKCVDYIIDRKNWQERLNNRKIVFAGNLKKSEFLKYIQMDRIQYDINLYGDGFDEGLKHQHIFYKGCFAPDVLVEKLEGSFGLVWDGNDPDGCEGEYGKYVRFNHPHKLSLYIVSGVPVIVWKQAAVAKFVEENKIGFSVESLYEINDRLNSLTNDQYGIYLNNTIGLAKKISQGFFTMDVLKKIGKIHE